MSAKKFKVILNSSSGGMQSLGREGAISIFKSSDLSTETIDFCEGQDIQNKLEEAAAGQNPVLVGGGDGTINLAAPIFREKQKGFGVLPLGTMNLMAQDLGVNLDIRQAISQYAQGTRLTFVDAGYVNDKLFLCNAALGTIPEAAVFREEHRDEASFLLFPRLTAFILDQLDNRKKRWISLKLGDEYKRKRLSSVVVSNNAFANQDNIVRNGFERKGLQNKELGVYTVTPKNLWDKLRLLFRFQFGFWKNDSVIKEYKTQQLEILTDNEKERVSIDGETTTLETPLLFRIEPQSIPIYVPSG